jgi:IS30 family transposase
LQAVSQLGEREHRKPQWGIAKIFSQKTQLGIDNTKKLDKVLSKINSTPMKCLGYKTPSEVFAKCRGVALAC